MMARFTTQLFIFFTLTVVVMSSFKPMEKMHKLKAKGAAAMGQVKSAVNRAKARTQEKYYNMKSYFNYLKSLASGGMKYPYYGGYYQPYYGYTTSYQYQKPYTYGYKYAQPYSFTNFYSSPGYYFNAGVKHWY